MIQILYLIARGQLSLLCLLAKLFFMYANLINKMEIHPGAMIIAILRFSLHSVDLAFAFSPSNKLKQEVS